MMPAHVARFAPDATAQVGVSCLGYKAHFIATVAPAATWCGEIIQENLSQGSPNSLPKSSIRRKFSFSFSRARACTCGRGEADRGVSHHVWPVAVVLFAAVVNVVWIAVLGYAFIRLVL
jgi:hypothetical protein